MNLKLTHIRLCVDDLPACVAFYRDVLKLTPRFDPAGSVYAEFDAGGGKGGDDGVTLALFEHQLMQAAVGMAHDDAVKGPGERVVLTFFVDSVDARFAELKKVGVTVAREPHDEPAWMLRVAHFRDPAGNLLELHQPLAGQKV